MYKKIVLGAIISLLLLGTIGYLYYNFWGNNSIDNYNENWYKNEVFVLKQDNFITQENFKESACKNGEIKAINDKNIVLESIDYNGEEDSLVCIFDINNKTDIKVFNDYIYADFFINGKKSNYILLHNYMEKPTILYDFYNNKELLIGNCFGNCDGYSQSNPYSNADSNKYMNYSDEYNKFIIDYNGNKILDVSDIESDTINNDNYFVGWSSVDVEKTDENGESYIDTAINDISIYNYKKNKIFSSLTNAKTTKNYIVIFKDDKIKIYDNNLKELIAKDFKISKTNELSEIEATKVLEIGKSLIIKYEPMYYEEDVEGYLKDFNSLYKVGIYNEGKLNIYENSEFYEYDNYYTLSTLKEDKLNITVFDKNMNEIVNIKGINYKNGLMYDLTPYNNGNDLIITTTIMGNDAGDTEVYYTYNLKTKNIKMLGTSREEVYINGENINDWFDKINDFPFEKYIDKEGNEFKDIINVIYYPNSDKSLAEFENGIYKLFERSNN